MSPVDDSVAPAEWVHADKVLEEALQVKHPDLMKVVRAHGTFVKTFGGHCGECCEGIFTKPRSSSKCLKNRPVEHGVLKHGPRVSSGF